MTFTSKNTAILLALGIGGAVILYLALMRPGIFGSQTGTLVASSTAPSGIAITAALVAQTAPPPDGYIKYENDAYHFSFYHSPQGKVTVFDEGGGATTVTLENLQRVRGFQVFIVPYTESKISEERFKKDVPSGVRTDVENTTLDGVPAVTFVSYDQSLGDTREIWAIRGGYLYEITTLKGTGAWFGPIIGTWKFL